MRSRGNRKITLPIFVGRTGACLRACVRACVRTGKGKAVGWVKKGGEPNKRDELEESLSFLYASTGWGVFFFFSVFIELQEGIKGGREDLSVSVSVWIRSVFLLRCM